MKKGFTMLEMMIVLAVIALVSLISIPNITKYINIINDTGCNAQIETINAAIVTYELKYGEVPTINDLLEEGLIEESQTVCKQKGNIVIEDDKAKLR